MDMSWMAPHYRPRPYQCLSDYGLIAMVGLRRPWQWVVLPIPTTGRAHAYNQPLSLKRLGRAPVGQGHGPVRAPLGG